MIDPETRIEVSDTNGSHPDKVDSELIRIFLATPVLKEHFTPPVDEVKYEFNFEF